MKKIAIALLLFFVCFSFGFSQKDDSTKTVYVLQGEYVYWYLVNTNTCDTLSYATYKNGEKHGKWIIKDENLVTRCELYYDEGKKVGTWKIYDEFGKLKQEESY